MFEEKCTQKKEYLEVEEDNFITLDIKYYLIKKPDENNPYFVKIEISENGEPITLENKDEPQKPAEN